MKKSIYLFTFLVFQICGYSQTDFSKKTEKLDKLFSKLLSDNPKNPVANILCFLENENTGLMYCKSFGTINLEQNKPVVKEQPFKIASITKTFTAVIILQMVEEGLINLDDKVFEYLENFEYLNFDKIHLLDGKSYGKEITIKQLLNHRSGLADMFEDTREQFDAHVMNNKQKQWSPKLLFQKYYDLKVNTLAKFKPGSSYAYTDVGYFLLGLCIEKISGKSLAKNYRNRIIEPLGLSNTYFEYYEEKTSNLELAHAYVNNLDATKHINTSFDWAGGGLVSNTENLAMFIKGLFNHKLFKKDNTLNQMIESNMYGYGISVFNFDGQIYYGHLGFWGSGVFYNPTIKTTICLSINQTEPPFNAMKLIKRIRKYIE